MSRDFISAQQRLKTSPRSLKSIEWAYTFAQAQVNGTPRVLREAGQPQGLMAGINASLRYQRRGAIYLKKR